MNKVIAITICTIVLTLSIGVSVRAQLVDNPSFETGDFPLWNVEQSKADVIDSTGISQNLTPSDDNFMDFLAPSSREGFDSGSYNGRSYPSLAKEDLISTNMLETNEFIESDKLLPSDGMEFDLFGWNVSIYGDWIIVGSEFNENLTSGGSAYLYKRNANGVWIQKQKINASDGTGGETFGHGVAISGDTAIIGAFRDDDDGNSSGSAYIFEKDEFDIWHEVQKLTASDADTPDAFGISVSIAADRAIVGAYQVDDNGDYSGAAYIFERDPSGSWNEVQKIAASDGRPFALFGWSVSISGDKAIVGAPFLTNEMNEIETGSAYIYERDSFGVWNEVKILEPADAGVADEFGYSVSIFNNKAIVGANRHDIDGQNNSGAAYVFEKDGSGTWNEVQKLIPNNPDDNDQFGISVSILDDRAVVGALVANGITFGTGAAYLFERNDIGVWNQVQKLSGSDSESGHDYGRGVSIDQDTIVIGAVSDNDNGSRSGSAYVYILGRTGNLTITKQSLPAGETGFSFIGTDITNSCELSSSFSLDDDAFLSCDLAPKTYTVEETVSNMFTLTDIDCVGGSPFTETETGITIDLQSDDTIVCTFTNTKQFPLTLNKIGNGDGNVTSSPAGISCNDGCTTDNEDYNIDTMVTLTAAPNSDSNFGGWGGACSGAGTETMVTITMDAAKTCEASFTIKQFNVDVVVNGSGTGNVTYAPGGAICPGDCSETYDIHTAVTLNPAPAGDSLFTGWSGPADCSDGIIQNLTSNTTCTANFTIKTFDLNVNLAGNGIGNVGASGINCGDGGADCQETYTAGTEVALVAIPNANSTFSGFSGNPDCADGFVTMNTAKNCTATFNFIPGSDIALNLLDPGEAGVQNTLSVNGAVPNGDVTFIYSFGLNSPAQANAISLSSANVSTRVAPDDICQGLDTPLVNPRILRTIQADGNGDTSFSFNIPASLAGVTAFIQAVDITSCTGSNVNNETITEPQGQEPPVLLPLNPGTAGQQNTLSATNATPNSNVRFIWSFNQGNVTANNICQGFQSGIVNPRILPLVQSDGSGAVSLNVNVPSNLAGISLFLQAVDIATCTGSNVNAETL